MPKFRKKSLFTKIRKYLKRVFHELAMQRGSVIVSGNMALDHVHMGISIPPKYAVSEVIGYLESKSTIAVVRKYVGKNRDFYCEKLWVRGCAESSVGFKLEKVKKYISQQERLEKDQEDGKY